MQKDGHQTPRLVKMRDKTCYYISEVNIDQNPNSAFRSVFTHCRNKSLDEAANVILLHLLLKEQFFN